MKERPILFSREMVRAILNGQKTQTRRVIKPQPPREWPYVTIDCNAEAWWHDASAEEGWPEEDTLKCPYGQPGDRLWVRETWGYTGGNKITLEITGVRVERVQDIAAEDAKAEGVAEWTLRHGCTGQFDKQTGIFTTDWVATYAGLWNSINANRGYGWDVNPWVWVIEFRVIGTDKTS